MTDLCTHGDRWIECPECYEKDVIDRGYRAGQVAALRMSVVGWAFEIDYWDALKWPTYVARLTTVQRRAIEALAALGEPDAIRMMGGRE